MSFVEEITNMYMTCCAGYDYDGVQFAIGTVDAEFEQQAVVLFTDKLCGSDKHHIVFSVSAVRRWVNMYGREQAENIAAFIIGYDIGLIKQVYAKGTSYEENNLFTPDDETMAEADAYAREALGGVSKEFVSKILTDMINSGLGDTNLSLWRRASLDTAIESRVSRMAVKKYMWEGKVPNLESPLHNDSALVVSVCKDAYIERTF